ncbi:hypothetical protein KW805_02185 [Candidatus Pacearchaeota archaeon]|nr:hypothetical protein [Candidatus Pacearchaeota archaeon]
MGVSLNVFKIKSFDKGKVTSRTITIPQQQTWGDTGYYDEIGSPKSTLTKIEDTKDVVSFKVKHHSETIKRPVRVFWGDLEDNSTEASNVKKVSREIPGGYQEIFDFVTALNLKDQEAYIFTKNQVATSLQKRLRKSGIATLESIKIDLSKLDDCQEVNNIWGIWEDGVGKCKKKALFGAEISKDNQHNKEKATSYNLEYELGKEIIDLTISSSGGISSKSKEMTKDDLLTIYRKLKEMGAVTEGSIVATPVVAEE